MLNTMLIIIALLLPLTATAGNEKIESFSTAKKLLEKSVYFDNRVTLYCGASFDAKKNITLPVGFQSDKYVKRSNKVEWEHVVPAENFGRTFVEWREGDSECISNKGRAYKGRRCANKANKEYRFMQSDLYNLFPAIGSVNALRSNYNFTMLSTSNSDFGSCAMKIDSRKAEPPVNSRGRIARTYLYIEQTYKRYSMSKQQRQLINSWDKQFPVSEWECKRAERIEKIQGNVNNVLKERCS